MKQIILAIASILSLGFNSTVCAQPTLTAATNNPVVGDVLVFHACDTAGVNMGLSGSAITWNLGDLITNHVDTTQYDSCTATPYCDSFPGSNIVTKSIYGYYYYYTENSNVLTCLGYATLFTKFHYTLPLNTIYFPLTYNNTNVDTAKNVFSNGSTTYIDSFVCDGYGTLILPSGITDSNTLRVHEIQFVTDVLDTVTYHWRKDYYLWYTTGIHAAVAYMGYDTVGTGISYLRYVGYTTKGISSGINTVTVADEINLFPNPANDILTINVSDNSYSKFLIFNEQGMKEKEGTLNNNNTQIELQNLNIGIKWLQIIGKDGIITQKFIKL